MILILNLFLNLFLNLKIIMILLVNLSLVRKPHCPPMSKRLV